MELKTWIQSIKNLSEAPRSLIIQNHSSINLESLRDYFFSHLVNLSLNLKIDEKKAIIQQLNNDQYQDLILINNWEASTYTKKDLLPIFDAIKLGINNSRLRFIVINDAEKLDKSTSNSLLKLVEEPGDFNFIILLVNNYNAIIDTIKSRCIYLNFFSKKEELKKDAERSFLNANYNQSETNFFLKSNQYNQLYDLAENFLKSQKIKRNAVFNFEFQKTFLNFNQKQLEVFLNHLIYFLEKNKAEKWLKTIEEILKIKKDALNLNNRIIYLKLLCFFN